eukprot:scaffold363_cov331-Pavlova_lutheri.AAC.28
MVFATLERRTDVVDQDRSTVLARVASCSKLASSLPNVQLQLRVEDVLRPGSDAGTVDAEGDGPPCPKWMDGPTSPRTHARTRGCTPSSSGCSLFASA